MKEEEEKKWHKSDRRRAKTLEIKPLNKAQECYDLQIASKDVIFGVGPAGTGKTWLAAMRAGQALKDKKIERIVVTRPAVTADEELGFLPGELDEKYGPYFRPVREAFEELFGAGPLEYLVNSGIIEARPLGLLRGATIKDAWLIADEMQNATQLQIKLLLSRIGQNAKFIINGDPTQSDLENGKSGLEDAVARFERFGWCGVTQFDVDDIVRSGIVRDVIVAYDERRSVKRYSSHSNDAESLVGVKRFIREPA